MITNFRINEKDELEGKVEIPQWDRMYTKDEIIAMLTEIQTEIEEMLMHYDPRDVSDLIQQKIDALKGRDNHENNN